MCLVSIELRPYLYLLSRRGLSLRGGGEALRSESESDTGRRGRDAEEVGREVDQLWATGEDRGLGRVDTPDRDLEKAKTVRPQATIKIIQTEEVRPKHRVLSIKTTGLN